MRWGCCENQEVIVYGIINCSPNRQHFAMDVFIVLIYSQEEPSVLPECLRKRYSRTMSSRMCFSRPLILVPKSSNTPSVQRFAGCLSWAQASAVSSPWGCPPHCPVVSNSLICLFCPPCVMFKVIFQKLSLVPIQVD
jgi:hypothetical protein